MIRPKIYRHFTHFQQMAHYNLSINNKKVAVEVEPDTPLLWVIRDEVGLTGTKFGCGMALCGACTIHLNGVPTRACQTPVSTVGLQKITTIEGLSTNTSHPVQLAWIKEQVPQCGYCQSGQIMAAAALLKSNPNPSDTDIENAMSGNLCRCGTYPLIHKAIKTASTMMKEKANTTK